MLVTKALKRFNKIDLNVLSLSRTHCRSFGSQRPRVAVSTLVSKRRKPNGFPQFPALFVGITAIGLFSSMTLSIENDQNVKENAFELVEVEKGLDPFPTMLSKAEYPVKADYTLLGYGTRAVTFLSFKIYGCGIYAATEDLELIPKVFDSKFLSSAFIDFDKSKSHRENLKLALENPEISRVLISNLLDSRIKLLVKITPIRNTDFNHLRDGLIKSIIAHSESKTDEVRLNVGLDQFRDAFSRRGSVPKNDDLLLELQSDGSLQLYHHSKKTGESHTLGKVTEPFIGKLLLEQYLSGPKPLSPSTKESVADRICSMV